MIDYYPAFNGTTSVKGMFNAGMSPITNLLGDWFYAFLIIICAYYLYQKCESASHVAIVSIIFGGFILTLIPEEAIVMFIVLIVVALVAAFKKFIHPDPGDD